MKKVIFGSALFISGMIGISSVIISCEVTAAPKSLINYGMMDIILYPTNYNSINLAVPLIFSIFLMVWGVIFVFGGFRDKGTK